MRKDLGIKCKKEHIDSLELIMNKIQCAKQASCIHAIPDDVPEQKVKWFVQAAIESLANYQWLEKDWWNQAKKVYALPQDKNIWIDFNSGDFYVE